MPGSRRRRSPAASDDAGLFPPHLEEIEGVSNLDETPSGPDEYAVILESQCGATDDSQDVERYDGTLGVTTAFVNAHQGPVGQVQWNSNLAAIYTNPGNVSGVRWGSGTLISNDLFLTAGHLFDQTGGGWQRPLQNGTMNVISPQEIATNMSVNFNFQFDPNGVLRPVQTFAILQLIEYRLGGVDFAIIRLAGTPGSTFGFTQVSATDAAVGDMLAIIGHPAGVPKRIEAGPATTVSSTQITYNDIDTLGGNSGSGISRSPDGALVGVHTNGGCNVQGTGSNFGSPIVAIRNNSPTIRNLGIATFKGPDDGTGTALKVIDDGGTINKVRDDLTLKNPDDGTGTALKVIDDGGTLNKFRDDILTLKNPDDGGTPNKFRDDISTVKALDDGVSTTKARDDLIDPGKQFSDVKTPALDKAPGSDLGGGVIDPGGPIMGGGRARPFILATPHHAAEWAGGPLQEGAAGLDADLQEIETLLAQAAQCLDAVGQMYVELRAAYDELVSQVRGM